MTIGALRASTLALSAAAFVLSSPLSAAGAATVVHHPAHAIHGRVTYAHGRHVAHHYAHHYVGGHRYAYGNGYNPGPCRGRRRGRSAAFLGVGLAGAYDCGGYKDMGYGNDDYGYGYGPYYGGFGYGYPGYGYGAGYGGYGYGRGGYGGHFRGGVRRLCRRQLRPHGQLRRRSHRGLRRGPHGRLWRRPLQWRRAFSLARDSPNASAPGGLSGRPFCLAKSLRVRTRLAIKRERFASALRHPSGNRVVGRAFPQQEGRLLARLMKGGRRDLQHSSNFGHRNRRGRFDVLVDVFRHARRSGSCAGVDRRRALNRAGPDASSETCINSKRGRAFSQ